MLKSRDAKLEGAKVRNFDQVSRLLLFPYHIWKNVRTEEILINLIRYECVILKKCRKGTGRLSQVSFLYAQKGTKTDRYRFSVFREKQDKEGIRRREDFIKWEIMKTKYIL